MKILCEVFRASAREGVYLYTDRAQGLDVVPDELKEKLGTLSPAMSFVLTEDKKLAKLDPKELIKSLQEEGYRLQITTPEMHDEAREMRQKNSKLYMEK